LDHFVSLIIALISIPNINEISQALVGIVAGAGAIGAIYLYVSKKIVIPVKKYFSSISDSIGQIPKINNQISEISKELSTNGGMSIKDSVNRIDKNMHYLEQRQKAILTSSKQICYFETDSRGNVTTVNRLYQRLTNRTIEELLGYGWLNTIEESDREEVRSEWNRCISNIEEFHDIFYIQNTDGIKYRVRIEAFPIKSKDDSLLGYVGFLKEVEANGARKYD
jgi:PAS domain S-box-containing protein